METRRKKVVKKEKPQSKKIGDFGTFDRSASKADQYWKVHGIKSFVATDVKTFNVDALLIKKFRLRGLEFGNWVTTEDRWNYLNQLAISLANLDKVLKFNKNIGLKSFLTIALGARGKGKALAHYEPWSDVINITRYKKGTPEAAKGYAFTKSGGFGSYAHEYGHFLDYFFGKYIDQSTKTASLTGGRSEHAVLANGHKPGTLRFLMFNVLEAIMWLPGKPKTGANPQLYIHANMTKYYRELRIMFAGDDYWTRQNEIFARAFEQYVQFKLKQLKIKDVFLSHVKYTGEPYMNDADLKRIIKPMDALIAKMGSLARS